MEAYDQVGPGTGRDGKPVDAHADARTRDDQWLRDRRTQLYRDVVRAAGGRRPVRDRCQPSAVDRDKIAGQRPPVARPGRRGHRPGAGGIDLTGDGDGVVGDRVLRGHDLAGSDLDGSPRLPVRLGDRLPVDGERRETDGHREQRREP